MIHYIYKNLNLALISLVVLLSVSSVSCDRDEEVNAVMLEAFGPSPVLRGNDVTFVGENMDKVRSIILPEDVEVTDITVLSNSEISITIPQNAMPGKVTLQYDGGSVVSKSSISYAEPFEITALSPIDKAIREGDTVTISGDYLDNITKVIFPASASVDTASFISQSRYEIVLLLPKEAASGKIIIEDYDENQLYSDDALIVSQPVITALSPLSIKAGENVTLTGQFLDLVVSVTFKTGLTVEAASFVSQSESSIVVATPETAKDGAISLLSFAGVEVVSTQELNMLLPSNLTIEAVVFKAGLEMMIKGDDLDLVSSIVFTDAAEMTEFTYADGTITVLIPEDAKDGVLALHTAAEKSVETTPIVLIKPSVTTMAPNPVMATEMITITGDNLDLVKSITFGGDVTVEVTSSATEIKVTVPLEALTGELSLNMANGTSLATESLTVNNPEFCFIPVLPSPDSVISAGSLFSFDMVNGGVLTGVTVAGNVAQFIIDGEQLHVLLPSNINGAVDLKLVSSNGDITYEINVTGSGVVETVIFEGPIALTWGDGGRAFVPTSGFEGVSAGSVMKISFVQNDNWGQAQINNGAWATLSFAELGNDGYLKTDIYNDKTVNEQELVLTQEILDNILANGGDGNGLVIQGSDWIIAKISIITTAPTAETLWEGEEAMGGWASSVQLSADLFANAAVGKTITLSIKDQDAAATYWQVALKNGADWSDIEIADISIDATSHDFVIDANMLAIMQTSGLIFSGANYSLTKVEIK